MRIMRPLADQGDVTAQTVVGLMRYFNYSFVGAERVRRLLARYRRRQRQTMRVVGPEYEACRKQ